VILVSLPWTTLTEPSLGLGILKAVLDDAGIDCTVRHLNIFMLRFLKAATYFAIGNVFALNDFLFSGVLDPDCGSAQRPILRQKAEELLNMSMLDRAEVGGVNGAIEALFTLRNETIPRWLDECAERIAAEEPDLVGFTCMFDQTIASAALAKLVKQRLPGATVALGGYAVRQPTADTVLRAFDWIDAICLGDGEPVVVPLARAAAARTDLDEIPGIVYRDHDGRIRTTAPPAQVVMDTVPAPDYRDFYRDVEELAREHHVDITVGKLPVENSRGCWWGAIKHCVFCGIHDDDLAFRAKSAPAALAVMDELHRRHGATAFRFADYILPRKYFDTLLPELARRGAPYDVTAEIKANVSPRAFATLAAAGFTEVQPGIESFSSGALKKMDKGTSMLQNIQTLLLGVRHGITVHYNLLYAFPDDEVEDYERLAETLTRLTHLNAPATRLEVQVTRYAPLQVDPARFGIPEAWPEPTYRLIFSPAYLASTGFELDKFCYYFQRPFENAPALNRVYKRINRIVDEWRAMRKERPATLTWRRTAGGIEVTDTRYGPMGQTHLLADEYAAVLVACTGIQSISSLRRRLPALDYVTIGQAIATLDELRLVAREGERVLSLVLAEDPSEYEYQGEDDEAFRLEVLTLGAVR